MKNKILGFVLGILITLPLIALAVTHEFDVGFGLKILDKDGDAGTAGQVLSSTSTQVDWIDAAGGGVGAGFDWRNPYDVTTMSSFVHREGDTSTYTVTAGKVLLLQRMNGNSTTTMKYDPAGVNLTMGQGEVSISSPIIIPAGDGVAQSALNSSWSGIEVTENANITPIIQDISNGVTYTVPVSTIFVMTNLYVAQGTYVLDLGIDYDRWWSGMSSNHDNSGSSNDFGTPSLIPAGEIISISGAGADKFTIMGYEIPDDFDF